MLTAIHSCRLLKQLDYSIRLFVLIFNERQPTRFIPPDYWLIENPGSYTNCLAISFFNRMSNITVTLQRKDWRSSVDADATFIATSGDSVLVVFVFFWAE